MIYLRYDLTSGEIAIVEGATEKHCLNHGLRDSYRTHYGNSIALAIHSVDCSLNRITRMTRIKSDPPCTRINP